MNFRIQYPLLLLVILVILPGCSGGSGKDSPVSPGTDNPGGEIPELAVSSGESSHGHMLMGYWDFVYDFDTREFEVIPLRFTPFHVNVVMYMQSPSNLGVKVVSENFTTGEFTVDVNLTHPFPNTDLMGFDVRGIVFGRGPKMLTAKDDPDLMWLDHNGLRLDNADGWTRWWNSKEFKTPGLFGYTDGAFGTKNVNFSTTLNPYKYFANVLSKSDPVVPKVNETNRGSFATNQGSIERTYNIVFPVSGGFPDATFQYALDACWAPPTGGGSIPGPHDFPVDANCEEPFYLAVDTSESTAFYIEDGTSGGDVVIDLEVFDWGGLDGLDDDIAEITVNSGTLFPYYVVAPLDADPGSSPLSRMFHISIPNVMPTGLDNQEVMISVKTNSTYEPPAPGYNYPTGVELAAYAIATVPIKAFEPKKVGGFGSISGEFIDIKVIGNIAYVLDSVDGLVIANVTYPQNPIILATVSLPNMPVALDVEDGYAYIIDENSQFVVVRVDPIDSVWCMPPFGLSGNLTAIDSNSPEAYVCTQEGNLIIVDIDPPSSPSLILTVPIACVGPANDVRVFEGYAYVGDDLDVIDVDPPGSASSVKVVNTTNTVISVDYDDATGYLFCGNSTNSMYVMDASTPSNTNLVDTINLGGPVNDVNVQSDLIYATIGNDGLKICAFNEATENASLVGEVTLTDPLAVTSDDNMAYVIDNGEVQIIEVWEQEKKEGWGINWGSTLDDWTNAVIVDGSGNVYVCGVYQGTVDFDPGPDVYNLTSEGTYQDCFLAKYDSDGAILWAKGWGSGIAHDRCIDIEIYGNHIYVTGAFSDTVDFDTGPGSDNYTSNGQWDAFLTHYTTDGAYHWTMTWGGINGDLGNDLAIDSSGNIYVSGYFTGTLVDFDSGGGTWVMSSNGSFDAYITKYDSSGVHQWAYSWGSTMDDQGYAVACTDSEVFITGYFVGTVDFDPTGTVENHTSSGNSNSYVCKYNSSGTYLWTKTWGGSGTQDWCRDVATRGTGVICLAGAFSDTVDFDPGVGVVNRTALGDTPDAFLLVLTSNQGTYDFVRTWGSSGDGSANALCLDIDYEGSIYVTGMVVGSCDFDNEGSGYVLPALGIWDSYITKYDDVGNFEWARRWGGGGEETDNQGRGIYLRGDDGFCYYAGHMQGMVDFDPGDDYDYHVSDNGSIDAFVMKLKLNGYW